MTLEELQRVAAAVRERRGWDFSPVRDDRDPVPWDYMEVVRRYVRPSDRVLDIGTGGGERFIALAPHLGTGMGIDADPAMIEVAQENMPASLAHKVSFQVMRAEALQFPESVFDVVLNRHAPVHTQEIARVLRPDGIFITQQVGTRNFQNICSLFGCGPGGEYEWDTWQEATALAEAFQRNGCIAIAQGEYDVRYFFLDVESLVFNLKAVPIPEDFGIEEHWQQVDYIVAECGTPRGIETNEHRELLIVRKG
jgi:SAM-dependent methyltransferase